MRQPTCDCGECRKCKHRIYMRGWYQRKTPEERRAWVERRDPVKVREQSRLKMAKRRANPTPEQALYFEAYREVSNAKRRGDLVPGDCEMRDGSCEGRIHAHHHDYTKPLDVQWLCAKHHIEHHRKEDAT